MKSVCTSVINAAVTKMRKRQNTLMCMSDYRQDLDWKLDLLYTYTTHYYTSQITIAHRLVLSVCYSLYKAFIGSGFQRRTFPLLWVPEPSLCLNFQLLTAAAHD
jgi:hypothetical protein